jgi:hypothetical protein
MTGPLISTAVAPAAHLAALRKRVRNDTSGGCRQDTTRSARPDRDRLAARAAIPATATTVPAGDANARR